MSRIVPFLILCGMAASAPGEIRFREVSEAWGLDVRHHHAGSGLFYLIETMGSGVVIFDYDGDGDNDLFLVDSGPLPGYDGEAPRSRLLRNDGRGEATPRFVDVTASAGIQVTAYGMGAAAGDHDGDGDLDLYVTSFGPNQLFRNNGDGTFADVTAAAEVGEASWSASASFADVDGDGDLDLYVANYLDFSFDNNPLCQRYEFRTYCHPDTYNGVPDRFYRNDGPGADGAVAFTDVTEAAGLAPSPPGKGLGVVASDLDGDGLLDLYVANDMTPNFQFQNLGGAGAIAFEEIGMLTGTAMSDEGREEAGMGIGVGDLDGNGHPDLLVTHFDFATNALYSNTGSGAFVDRRFLSQLAGPSVNKVGFGAALADFDSDGDLDAAVANGHLDPGVDRWGVDNLFYKQPNQVFENLGGGRFAECGEAGVDRVRASRGLAVGDLDGDGDLDLVITNSNDRAEVYENRSPSPGRWLRVGLAKSRGNRHGVGARVVLETAGQRQVREVRTASSYLSQNELDLHFGTGEADRVEALELRWPDGFEQKLRGLPVHRRLLIKSGAP